MLNSRNNFENRGCALSCPYCGRAADPWHQELLLASLQPSCNYSPEWRCECLERHNECVRLEAMIDREARRSRLSAYGVEARRRAAAAGLPDPDAVATEAMSRVRELVLSRWRARNVASATA